MWVDKYGFEIFMGEQEERREGDRWVDDVPVINKSETKSSEKPVKKESRNKGLF